MKLGKLRVVERLAGYRYRFISCRRVNGRKTTDTDIGVRVFRDEGVDREKIGETYEGIDFWTMDNMKRIVLNRI